MTFVLGLEVLQLNGQKCSGVGNSRGKGAEADMQGRQSWSLVSLALLCWREQEIGPRAGR
jgi:hypothetical protein